MSLTKGAGGILREALGWSKAYSEVTFVFIYHFWSEQKRANVELRSRKSVCLKILIVLELN